MKRELELYVHIPFCVKKCAYCDFLSGPSDEKSRAEYIKYLCEEMRASKPFVEEYEVSTIFFGGGTPSILEGIQVQQIMDAIRETFSLREDVEITLEMNPGTVTEDKLSSYKKAGIHRLSIGLQSVHNEELRLLGRIHTFEEFRESYELARKHGFHNINIDLISAIPGQTVESWEETLKTIIALNPEHISAYSLIIESGTPFYEKYGEDGAKDSCGLLPSEEEERKIYWRTREILSGAGYGRYEISNYAKPGYECRHNKGYWKRVPYLGFGIGAATLWEESRYSNPAKIEDYILAYTEKFQGEPLSRKEQMEEFMFLGLRMMQGISRQVFKETFGIELDAVYSKQIHKLKTEGLLQEAGDSLFLTERGIDVSNLVFVEFML